MKLKEIKKVSQEAFTLVEMLVVLVVLSLFMIISSSSSQDGYRRELKRDLFFERLQNQIKLTHEWSGCSSRTSHVVFPQGDQEVIISQPGTRQDIVIIDLPSDLYIQRGLTVSFRDFGVTSGRFGTVVIGDYKNPNQAYKLVFQMGSGQFYVEK